jgi:hypothetical protein
MNRNPCFQSPQPSNHSLPNKKKFYQEKHTTEPWNRKKHNIAMEYQGLLSASVANVIWTLVHDALPS